MASRRIAIIDPTYPAALRELASPPSTLFIRGVLPTQPGIAIVGTRSATPDALRYTRSLARSLVDAGYVVWSGGALGIDQAAHEGALAAGGATVLVAGSGLDRPYPPGVAGLFTRIEQTGALVSIVDDTQEPRRWIFLARNAVLAALTQAIILVESPLKSGARSATAAARRLDRTVWIATQSPWSVFAPTVREETRLGSRLLLHVDDLLVSLAALNSPTPSTRPSTTSDIDSTRETPGFQTDLSLGLSSPFVSPFSSPPAAMSPKAASRGKGRTTRKTSAAARGGASRGTSRTGEDGGAGEPRVAVKMRQLSLVEASVMRALDEKPSHPDDLCVALGLAAHEISIALTMLELDG